MVKSEEFSENADDYSAFFTMLYEFVLVTHKCPPKKSQDLSKLT